METNGKHKNEPLSTRLGNVAWASVLSHVAALFNLSRPLEIGKAPADDHAWGVVNTALMMGGAVGLAILASLADSRTESLIASGHGSLAALNGGYHGAFVVGAVFLVAAAGVAAALLRVESPQAHGSEIGAPVTAEGD